MNRARPGFFGKVTCHGDFVTRALPPDIVQAWDGWMQEALQASCEQLGAKWLALYLTSPVWRFALSPGVLGADGWAGVMMPSVDRVGRHFPLMIAAPLMSGTPLSALVTQGCDWYDALEDLARDTLAADFVLDRLESALAALTPMLPVPAFHGETGAAGSRLACPERDALPAGLVDVLLQERSLWWSEGGPAIAPSMLVCPGMPAPSAFAGMLDGRWRENGWGSGWDSVTAPA